MRKLSTALMILMLIIGVGFFLYPDIASWWNGRHQRGMVISYYQDVAAMQQEELDYQLQRARDFNNALTAITIEDPFADLEDLSEDYMRTLNVGGTMARIEIPVVGINLPVLHGTSSSVLDRAAGHLVGTSFPIGGESTHSVITAHSGLSNARMFTDLLDGNVTHGDQFFISVMGLRLAYEVVQIDVVLPHEHDLIRIYPGEDFVTLITCTPFAINTHRLLIRGSRIPYSPEMVAEIVPVITVVHTNWRTLVALAAFLLFILVFSIYQLVRIIRGWRLKRAAKLGLASNREKREYIQVKGANISLDEMHDIAYDDPYIALPQWGDAGYIRNNQSSTSGTATARRNAAKAAYPSAYDDKKRASSKRRKKPGNVWQKTAAGISILLLTAGLSVMLYPRVQQQMHTRYAQEMITDFRTRVEGYRIYHRQRIARERVASWVSGYGLATGIPGQGLTPNQRANLLVTVGNFTYDITISDIPIDERVVLLLAADIITVYDIIVAVIRHLDISLIDIMSMDFMLEAILGEGFTIEDLISEDFSLGDILSEEFILENLLDGNFTFRNFLPDDFTIDDIIINGQTVNEYVNQLLTGGEFDIDEAGNGFLPDKLYDFDFDFSFGFYYDPLHFLYEMIVEYNQYLYETNQVNLTTLEAMEEVDFSLVEHGRFTEEMIGYITIEAINLSLPIFSGSSESHMLRGAAHLTQSSMPVGGINTNAVITAHRGLSRARMFNDIVHLVYGDVIVITNFYGTLRYAVVGTRVILPYLHESVLIQEGRDMLTIFTCYPYRVNTHRFLVYAERIPD